MKIFSTHDTLVKMSPQMPTSVYRFLLAFAFIFIHPSSSTTSFSSPDVCLGEEWSCKGRCDEFRSLPCSCDIRCLVYRTCCEDYNDVCDYASNSFYSNISKFVNVSYVGISNYAFIEECLNKTDPDDVRLCEDDSPVLAAGRLGPVTDLSLGLQFKNGACLRCNDLEEFIPWPIVTLCDNSLLEQLGKLDLSIIGKMCSVYVRPPALNSSFYNPVYRLALPSQSLDEGKCSPEQEQLCRSFFSYVTVTTPRVGEYLFRNRYCVICSGWSDVTCYVPLFEGLVPHGYSSFSSLLNWNIDGSWIITSNTGEEAVDTVCGVDPGSDQESCKVMNCPNWSVPVLESTYCLPIPIQVKVLFTRKKPKPDADNYIQLSLDLLSRDCECTISNRVEFSSTSVILPLSCDWSPTYKAGLVRLGAMYNILTTALTPHISPNEILNMKIMYLSVFNFPIPESVITFSHNQLQSPVPPNLFEWAISMIGSALSLGCLCCRISIQPLSHLLNSQPGRMQCCLCVSLAFAYASFLYTQSLEQNSLPCWVISILMHLFYLCSLFWMNAITVDLWKRFRSGRILSSISESRSMKMVALYTCVLPIIVVGISITMDLVLPDSEFSPAYGQNLCWINNSYSLIIFFAVPVSVLSFVNGVLILHTFKSLHKLHKTSKFIQSLSKSSPVLSIGVCTKMASLTGVTWLLGVVAGLVDHFVLWVIFSAVNSSYGFIVALTLMYNRRLWHSIEISCKKRLSVAAPGVAVSPGGNSGPGGTNSYQTTTETVSK